MARKRRRPLAAPSLDAAVRELLEAPPPRNPDAEPERAVREFIAAVARGESPSARLLHWVAERLLAISDDPAHPARPEFGLPKRRRGRPVNDAETAKRLVYVAVARAYGHGLARAAELAARQFNKDAETMLELAKASTRRPAPDLPPNELRELEDTLLSWGVPLPERPRGRGNNSPN